MVYKKAVRDKIPEIIKKDGYSCNVRNLSNDDFLLEIEKKLNEEVTEYLLDKDPKELVDILEVVYTIAKLNGISKEQLEEIRIQKINECGSFDKNLFLINTTKNRTND